MKKYEKEKWESPRIVVEKFATNDSINACYEVYCYFPNNNSEGSIYQDSNGDGILDYGDKCVLNGNWSGDGVAEFTGTQPKDNGFWVERDKWGRTTGTVKPVFVYQGKSFGEGHSSWHAADLSDPLNTNAIKDISDLTPGHHNHS